MSFFSVKEALQAVQKPAQHRSWLMVASPGVTGSNPSINVSLSVLSIVPEGNDVTVEFFDKNGTPIGGKSVRLAPNKPEQFVAHPSAAWGRIRATHPVYPSGFSQVAWTNQPFDTHPVHFYPMP